MDIKTCKAFPNFFAMLFHLFALFYLFVRNICRTNEVNEPFLSRRSAFFKPTLVIDRVFSI